MSQDKITRENLATQLSEEFGIALYYCLQKNWFNFNSMGQFSY